MDPVTLTYYALICGLLSVAAPYLGNRLVRLAVGVLVGLVAAALLPLARAVMAGY